MKSLSTEPTFNFATRRLCSRRNMVCVAAKAGCSLALESPPLKQNPDSALHSKLSLVLGSKCLPLPWCGRVVFNLPSTSSLKSIASHLSLPYTFDPSIKAVFWLTCSRGPNCFQIFLSMIIIRLKIRYICSFAKTNFYFILRYLIFVALEVNG